MKGELVCLVITTVSIVKSIKKKLHDCCKNTCKCHDNKDNLVRASAFRARNTVNQNVPANTFVKVLFQNEQFDLANEYNPSNIYFYAED